MRGVQEILKRMNIEEIFVMLDSIPFSPTIISPPHMFSQERKMIRLDTPDPQTPIFLGLQTHSHATRGIIFLSSTLTEEIFFEFFQ